MIFFLASSESATLLPAHTLTTRSAFFSAGRFPLRLAQLEIAVTLSTMRMFCLCFFDFCAPFGPGGIVSLHTRVWAQ